MNLSLSPAKLVLLAVHFAVQADIDSLAVLAAHHDTVLRKDLMLRILLTYLPETLQSNKYVGFLENLEKGTLSENNNHDVDTSSVENLAEEDATKRVRKLRLLPLTSKETPKEVGDDPITSFLVRRSYKVDEEAGLLAELPTLLLPFMDHSPYVRTLLISTILPLLRRNCEYHPEDPIQYTLSAFQELPDRVAVNLLLAQTGAREEDLSNIGRDLRGLIGPWLVDEKKWKTRRHSIAPPNGEEDDGICAGYDEALRWLTTQASKNWKVAVSAIQQWNGPGDSDLAGWGKLELNGQQRDHVEQAYAQAALASAYVLAEASAEVMEGAYSIVAKVASLRDLESLPPFSSAVTLLPPLAEQIPEDIIYTKHATLMRNDLLASSNILTTPTNPTVAFLEGLILSAYLLTKAGHPCTIRRAGELALLQDERDQKEEATKLIHHISHNGPKTDDKFWIRARNEILWLRDWGAEEVSADAAPKGVFSKLKREFLEVEILKALLSNTRYALARSLYEEVPDRPIDEKLLQDTVYATAMTAYDNASNPNRTRGGLKKCDEIIKSFPETLPKSHPLAKKVEALLQATHALSEYRLVLKQGEPFTPIVLRVHSDPISIIGKILEQNPKSYTRLQDFLDLEQVSHRITAMCIDAALTEEDFETAYSYVVTRLPSDSISSQDDYSWRVALQAGKYRRSSRTVRPTHFGTSSANPEIRHLEQRIECLSVALRIAPPATLQEILNVYRRAEEELDAAIKAEEEKEEEWDWKGDSIVGGGGSSMMPGGFANSTTTLSSKPRRKSIGTAGGRRAEKEEEAPMSLFDLARATGLTTQKNLSALSGLQRAAGGAFGLGRGIGGGGGGGGDGSAPAAGMGMGTGTRNSTDSARSGGGGGGLGGSETMSNHDGEQGGGQQRARKRDQLKNAAMGTLVSGVGWLVGAPGPVAGGGGGGGNDGGRE
ncbi:secretory pathway protein Sec39-domain-containing protein [Apiosordaria backusii]|uniref:Secretory pathway protein Sec39-domain-containing protein n=1 Tax=Apiosordaria backusii TaxID=314023 RepID=A0AA40BSM6_9PEZI|nr:secretory pathway protein Sec39-domain-containing protein [Apiosordaria backusii]